MTPCAARPQVNQSTGPFHALLCVGQFFSPEGDAEGAPGDVADYIEGLASVPIPTYFTGDYGPSSGLGEATASPSTVCFLASLLCC